ncbi:pyruvoyl-dependent arginine decarboxylase [Candidatus Woesearchaeota archaeon]|nr:pyruvoyl-dependent arginine decarboxylase [Candidatus Woesearchaeota archaeon]
MTPDVEGIVLGCRIPKDYFTTQGTGESDITIHAGSYHLALQKAGIERCNIMTYSSIMPGISKEVKKPALVHGAVLESIMAVAHAEKGQRATAGIIYGELYDKETGAKYGGLVCEHNGDYSLEDIESKLRASIGELYENGFTEQYELKDIKVLKESLTPKKQYGTALVAICFTSYVFPRITEE